jgi:hypothetical protein
MAKAKKSQPQAKVTPAVQRRSGWPFGKKNYIMFAVAIAVCILGFIMLSTGDITLAPILLVLGYCVLMPIAIWIKGRPDEEEPIDRPAGSS